MSRGKEADALTDLELLVAEIDTLWTRDDRGRLVADADASRRTAPLLVIAVANDGRTAAFGSAVPDDLARALEALVSADAPDATGPPASLDRCEQILEAALGPVRRSSGPSYLIESAPAFEVKLPAIVTTSDQPVTAEFRSLVSREENWPADEWSPLLDGALGPWAIATVGERVASICHSARLTDRGAEAGVWTDPDFRGRGYAPAVTAAWAAILAGTKRHLFYSTSADNNSSQAVAARLGLRPIGWLWQLHSRA